MVLLLKFKLPVRNAERMGEWYEAERKRDALSKMYAVKRDALNEMYAVERDALELVLRATRCTP